jgi:hypothetical protein
LRSRITFSTFFDAFLLYLRAMGYSCDGISPDPATPHDCALFR